MSSLRKAVVAPVILTSLAMLSACGGGSGSGGNSDTPSDGGGSEEVTKSFTVSLDSVEVTRVSNGEVVEVDTSEVSSSGSLTISE